MKVMAPTAHCRAASSHSRVTMIYRATVTTAKLKTVLIQRSMPFRVLLFNSSDGWRNAGCIDAADAELLNRSREPIGR